MEPGDEYVKAKRSEISLVYLAGLVQGVALVTFPAASSIFTSPHPQGYGFSSSQYGAMFLPQVVLAILASSLAPAFARRWHLKRVFLLGLGSNLVSMALLALSNFFMSSTSLAYDTLLLATAALGLGFGMTVMAVNTYAEEFFPGRADSAVLALNALLGAGTALAPIFVIVFVGLGAWWLLPVLVGVVLVILLLFSVRAPLQVAADSATTHEGFMRGLPRRFWLYAAVVLLYGIVETLNGNWSTVYLTQQRGVPIQWASLALTAFWAMVTIGRVLAAVASSRVPARWIYLGLPILLVVAFLTISQVSTAIGGVLAFGFAGLACSAFFPLSISFGGEEFPRLTAVVSGELIAFYQVGYGIAAFGTGSLLDATSVPLSTIYAGASLVAGVMIVFAFLVIRPQTTKATEMSAGNEKGKTE
jgi:FHS family glucose/mannose:H+ symporter-like MFS transporter